MGYARVSSEDENIENQIKAIEEFAQANGFDLLSVFKDVGISGAVKAFEREGFRKMLDVAETLGVKTVIVYDLTRLSRDIFDIVTTYKTLLEKGFQVYFVKHPELNPSPVGDSPINDAMRKALLTLLGVVAEMEHALIRERTKAGIERARAEGRRLGRRPVNIPATVVRKYLSMGLSIRDVYRLLKEQGYLTYTDRKGEKHVLSYEQFWRRVKAMEMQKQSRKD